MGEVPGLSGGKKEQGDSSGDEDSASSPDFAAMSEHFLTDLSEEYGRSGGDLETSKDDLVQYLKGKWSS